MTAIIYGGDPDVREPGSDRNHQILAEAEAAYNQHTGPRVGDWVVFPDGHEERLCHHWGDSIQTTDGGFGSSFNLSRRGQVSFSGGLNRAQPVENFVLTDEVKAGAFWFFDSDWPRAHSAVYARLDCRVYRLTEVSR